MTKFETKQGQVQLGLPLPPDNRMIDFIGQYGSISETHHNVDNVTPDLVAYSDITGKLVINPIDIN